MAEQEQLGIVADVRAREIARRRGARDLWISRSHVAAAAAGSLAFAVLAFGLGFLVGKGQSEPSRTHASLVAELPRDELVQLLARIDGNSVGAGASGALTFPEELMGAPPVLVPPPAEGAPEALPVPVEAAAVTPPPEPGAVLELPAGGSVAVGDPRAAATGFTVVAGRFDSPREAADLRGRLARAGLDAWVATQLVDGAPVYRVGVGRHESRSEAVAALGLLASVPGASVESLDPAEGSPAGADPAFQQPPPTDRPEGAALEAAGDP